MIREHFTKNKIWVQELLVGNTESGFWNNYKQVWIAGDDDQPYPMEYKEFLPRQKWVWYP